MWHDTVDQYAGRELEWAAEVALYAVESSPQEDFNESDAEGLVDFVWEFVEQSCSDNGAPIPSKQAVIEYVRGRLQK